MANRLFGFWLKCSPFNFDISFRREMRVPTFIVLAVRRWIISSCSTAAEAKAAWKEKILGYHHGGNLAIRKPVTYWSHRFSTSVTADLNNEEWDVVICGGGMVGSAMACSLGFSPVFRNRKVLLLEMAPEYNPKPLTETYSNRVCSLNPGTRDFLDSIGVWKNICSLRMQPVKMMQVWEACSDALITFQSSSLSDDIAYIVENDVILRSIVQQLEQVKDIVTVLYGAKIEQYNLPEKVEGTRVEILLQNGQLLRTKLLIGADGFKSLVRKHMNVKCISWDYDQKGIVATLNLAEPIENNVSWQKFLPTGPIAVLPLSFDKASLVWSVSTPLAQKLMEMDDDVFMDSLNSALWDESKRNSIVDKVVTTANDLVRTFAPASAPIKQLPPNILSVEPGSRASFPLGLSHATRYISPRVALIGDAAHRVHPLAGLGVNLGFGDIKCLVEQLTDSLHSGQDVGELSPLQEYETLRQRDIIPKMGTIDLLHRLYSTSVTPLVLLRSVGLQLVNSINPVKQLLVRMASN